MVPPLSSPLPSRSRSRSRSGLLLLSLLFAAAPACRTPATDAAPPASDAASDASPATDAAPPDPYPNIARVDPTGLVTESLDGTFDLSSPVFGPGIGTRFYATHADDYDFLVVWADFTLATLFGGPYFAHSEVVANDVSGTGAELIQEMVYGLPFGTSLASSYGSAGRLEALCFLNGEGIYTGSLGPIEILTHEVGHRWGANLLLTFAPDPWILVDQWGAHWTIVAGFDAGSAVGYGRTVDNGDGTFTAARVVPMPYSSWDLYSMGLLPAADVPPMFYVDGASGFSTDVFPGVPYDQESPVGPTVTFAGTRVDFTVDDVSAALGPRTPPFGTAQTDFRFAFVLLCRPGEPCSEAGLAFVEQMRLDWPVRWEWAAGGRATSDTAL